MTELDEQLQTLKHKEIVKKAIIEVSKETKTYDYGYGERSYTTTEITPINNNQT